jgi:type II secretory pathway pseudopilin PulG
MKNKPSSDLPARPRPAPGLAWRPQTSVLRPPSQAFTLIELLVVIAIIMTLVGMLVTGASMATAAARKTRAKSETEQIASAWKMYYSEYQRWPDLITSEAPHTIDGDLAHLLSSGEYNAARNPRRLRFCQFNRTNSVGAAINPWGDEDETPADLETLYYVAIDLNFDNVIEPGSISNVTGRPVIVWTVNPKLEPGDANYIIGDWKE